MTADPNEPRRLRDLYANMSDGELEKLASEENSLTDEAQDALDDELDRRGIGDHIADPSPHPQDTSPQPAFQQLMTIREFRDLPAALLAQGLLQSSGIECFLDNANIVRMDWLWSNAVGGIKLRVRPEDAQAALEILKQPIPARFNVVDVGIYEQPKCPECESLDVAYEELNKPWSYATIAINLPIPIYNRVGIATPAAMNGWAKTHQNPRETRETDHKIDFGKGTASAVPPSLLKIDGL